MNILDFPAEILARIAHYLPFRQFISSFCCVCRKIKQYLECPSGVKALKIDSVEIFEQQDFQLLSHLGSFSGLTRLDIRFAINVPLKEGSDYWLLNLPASLESIKFSGIDCFSFWLTTEFFYGTYSRESHDHMETDEPQNSNEDEHWWLFTANVGTFRPILLDRLFPNLKELILKSYSSGAMLPSSSSKPSNHSQISSLEDEMTSLPAKSCFWNFCSQQQQSGIYNRQLYFHSLMNYRHPSYDREFFSTQWALADDLKTVNWSIQMIILFLNHLPKSLTNLCITNIPGVARSKTLKSVEHLIRTDSLRNAMPAHAALPFVSCSTKLRILNISDNCSTVKSQVGELPLELNFLDKFHVSLYQLNDFRPIQNSDFMNYNCITSLEIIVHTVFKSSELVKHLPTSLEQLTLDRSNGKFLYLSEVDVLFWEDLSYLPPHLKKLKIGGIQMDSKEAIENGMSNQALSPLYLLMPSLTWLQTGAIRDHLIFNRLKWPTNLKTLKFGVLYVQQDLVHSAVQNILKSLPSNAPLTHLSFNYQFGINLDYNDIKHLTNLHSLEGTSISSSMDSMPSLKHLTISISDANTAKNWMNWMPMNLTSMDIKSFLADHELLLLPPTLTRVCMENLILTGKFFPNDMTVLNRKSILNSIKEGPFIPAVKDGIIFHFSLVPPSAQFFSKQLRSKFISIVPIILSPGVQLPSSVTHLDSSDWPRNADSLALLQRHRHITKINTNTSFSVGGNSKFGGNLQLANLQELHFHSKFPVSINHQLIPTHLTWLSYHLESEVSSNTQFADQSLGMGTLSGQSRGLIARNDVQGHLDFSKFKNLKGLAIRGDSRSLETIMELLPKKSLTSFHYGNAFKNDSLHMSMCKKIPPSLERFIVDGSLKLTRNTSLETLSASCLPNAIKYVSGLKIIVNDHDDVTKFIRSLPRDITSLNCSKNSKLCFGLFLPHLIPIKVPKFLSSTPGDSDYIQVDYDSCSFWMNWTIEDFDLLPSSIISLTLQSTKLPSQFGFHLPLHLQHLDISTVIGIAEEGLFGLPNSLQELALNGHLLTPTSLKMLPPTVTSLIIINCKRWDSSYCAELPRNLKNFEIDSSDLHPNGISNLPDSVTRIVLEKSLQYTVSKWPSNLVHLHIPTIDQHLSSLPSSVVIESKNQLLSTLLSILPSDEGAKAQHVDPLQNEISKKIFINSLFESNFSKQNLPKIQRYDLSLKE